MSISKSLRKLAKELKNPEGFKKSAGAPIQWTTGDDSTYFPAGKAMTKLPPGFYTVEESMQGHFFAKKPLKTEKLLKFPDSSFDSVVNEIENFWDLEQRFDASEIPYKRGILLYGPPGSGKTCLLKIVVDNLINKRGGLVIDFGAPWTFKEGYHILRQVEPNTPIVALMEDVDAILDRYSESDVLNILDGMGDIRRAVFLATTNYPEKLGGRIMNRPSRFDKKIYIGMPSKQARELFIRLKLGEADEAEIQQWVEDTDGFSVAHIKELFVASKILGDPYDQALDVLRRMKITPSSELFDDYKVEREDWGKFEKAVEVTEYPSIAWDSDSKYAAYGTGTPYKLAKIAFERNA